MSLLNNELSIENELGILSLIRKHTDIIFELGKVRITFFVALTTSVGYLVYSANLTWNMILPAFGVFLLACASASLNHYQERKTDALMNRTKSRPIPSGRIEPGYAVSMAALFLFAGSFMIFFSSNITALIIGWITLLWYNAVYTPMKKKYALAVIPGSLIGALPPVIGYTAAGGSPFNIQIMILALFVFIWQIPHFWLLLLIFGNDYERAGFPTLVQKYSEGKLSRITFIWIVILVFASMLIPGFRLSSYLLSFILILLFGLWLLVNSSEILSEQFGNRKLFSRTFFKINIYVLAVILIISIDKLLH